MILQPLAPSIGWRPRAVFVLLLGYLALFGVLVGAQGVLWAEIIRALTLSKAQFGAAQLLGPLLSVGLLMVGAQLSHWFGKKTLAIIALILLAASNTLLALAGNLSVLIIALLLTGAGAALLETAANSATLDWEQATGRSVMNLLHAGFSAGAVLGAFAAGLMLGMGLGYPVVLFSLAGLCGVMLLFSLPARFPPTDTAEQESPGPLATLRLLFSQRAMLILAALCVMGVVGESVANLWSVIYLRELGADALLGGAAFALFNGAMFAGRIMNTWVVQRWGMRVSLLLSGAGLVLANVLLAGGLWFAVAAFMLMGLAVAGIVPTVLSAGARLAPGRSGLVTGGIMSVAYTGFIVIPPITGWVADSVLLRAALLIVGLSGVAVLALARRLRG